MGVSEGCLWASVFLGGRCGSEGDEVGNGGNLRFLVMDCRKGGPTLRTMPERMYWKQDIKKRLVFSEFSMLDFSFFTFGGMNLDGSKETLRRMWLGKFTYHGCRRTASKQTAWTSMHISTWPSRGVSTFRETRLAVGRLRQRVG